MTNFDRQPTLVGETLLLRPLVADDWDALFAVASDPLLWALHPAHDRWQEAVFRAFFNEGLASGGALVVIDRSSNAIIGSSRYDFGRADPGEVEIGWTFLAPSHWGGAANGEMKRLMLAHAFAAVPVVIFLIGETNLRSRRALEKLGGRDTGRRHHAVQAGQPMTHMIHAITRQDFAG